MLLSTENKLLKMESVFVIQSLIQLKINANFVSTVLTFVKLVQMLIIVSLATLMEISTLMLMMMVNVFALMDGICKKKSVKIVQLPLLDANIVMIPKRVQNVMPKTSFNPMEKEDVNVWKVIGTIQQLWLANYVKPASLAVYHVLKLVNVKFALKREESLMTIKLNVFANLIHSKTHKISVKFAIHTNNVYNVKNKHQMLVLNVTHQKEELKNQ